RRLQRAGGEQHLAARAQRPRLAADARLDTDRAPALEDNARRLRVGDDAQVGARKGRPQVRLGGAETLAGLVRHLVETDAFLRRAVEVGVDRVACLARGVDEDWPEAVRALQVHDV